MAAGTTALRYLDAAVVLGPQGKLRDFFVSDTGGSAIGKLAGFVIDPAARQLRYFVVEAARWLSTRRYLVPLCPATLDPHQKTVKLDCDPSSKTEWREFDDRLFSRFSDDDLIAAIFRGPQEDDGSEND